MVSDTNARLYQAIANGDAGIAWSEDFDSKREAIWQACWIAGYNELDGTHNCSITWRIPTGMRGEAVDPVDYGWGSDECEAWIEEWRDEQWVNE